jgi:polysaccharide pyruvyl transferase WcaK-like protein
MESPNIFNTKNPYSLANKVYGRTPFAKYSWVNKIKIPKAVLGCGVNAESPGELSRWNIKGLEQFDFIGLRDNNSVNILRAYPQLQSKVHLFFDLAYAIPQNILSGNKKNHAVVIPTDRFSFGDYGVRKNNIAVNSIFWLEKKLQSFDKTTFLAFGEQDNDDYKTCRILANSVKCSEILSYNELTLPKVIEILSESSMVYPYRLHGLILSHIVGSKFEFYPYHWKLQRVYETIKNLSPKEIQLKQKEMFNQDLIDIQ